ncbi:DUF2764 family protein [uncultured Sphaerochaeta sp.]|uniref:DUF2764 family protein n=1 Tax=uncultured Sphaerochaeta sp. TaxID=886478 RepID=UPI002A0A4CD8|nr:DUF2764 family protein [uncultured Sphaerochaeta sp.]
MASYYYLVATLPMLHHDGTAPFGCDEFLEKCKGKVSDSDFVIISQALANAQSTYPFLKKWQAFTFMVKQELTDQRSRKLSMASVKYQYEGSREPKISEAVRQALGNDNPLAAELDLILFSWKYLDDLAVLHTFDLEGLLAYAIKLQLLERKGLFTREDGNAEFKRLFSNLQSEIKNI